MFKSKAQLAKFAEMVKQGKMSKDTFHEWLKATPSVAKLPERLEPKPRASGPKKVKVIR